MNRLCGRSLLRDDDLSKDEFLWLVHLAEVLRGEKQDRAERQRLCAKNIALIFEKPSTRTRSAFEVAAHDQGAHVTYLGPDESQMVHKESVRDTAKVLGRMFDGIEFRGFAHHDAELLAAHAGVPVWNGLTDEWHPTQMLADVLTIRDHSRKPLEDTAYCYLGDARNNTANSFLVSGALLGMDVRVAAPKALWPDEEVQAIADRLRKGSGGTLTLTDSVEEAVAGADFLYTDVWVSMGEPLDAWDERIDALLPYQLNANVLRATKNPNVRLLHCLPAMHDINTEVGRQLFERRGIRALEITDEVFTSPASIVFDQAENRLHTIKATMVATLP
jgi:ornithine carbamoyltransferase